MLTFSDQIRNGVLKMSIIKRIAAILLVAVMALSLTGCGDTTWIMKADGLVINSGLNDVAFDVIKVKIDTLLKEQNHN